MTRAKLRLRRCPVPSSPKSLRKLLAALVLARTLPYAERPVLFDWLENRTQRSSERQSENNVYYGAWRDC